MTEDEQNKVRSWAFAAERAEADNAALLSQFEEVSMRIAKLSAASTPLQREFREALEQLAGDLQRMSLQMRGATGTRRHPGAAMLERMRALETGVDVLGRAYLPARKFALAGLVSVTAIASHGGRYWEAHATPEEAVALGRALDALKVPHE